MKPKKTAAVSSGKSGFAPKYGQISKEYLQKHLSTCVSLCARPIINQTAVPLAVVCLSVMCISKKAIKQCSLLLFLCIHIIQHSGRSVQHKYKILDDVIGKQYFNRFIILSAAKILCHCGASFIWTYCRLFLKNISLSLFVCLSVMVPVNRLYKWYSWQVFARSFRYRKAQEVSNKARWEMNSKGTVEENKRKDTQGVHRHPKSARPTQDLMRCSFLPSVLLLLCVHFLQWHGNILYVHTHECIKPRSLITV